MDVALNIMLVSLGELEKVLALTQRTIRRSGCLHAIRCKSRPRSEKLSKLEQV
jgi:hypothetical protein